MDIVSALPFSPNAMLNWNKKQTSGYFDPPTVGSSAPLATPSGSAVANYLQMSPQGLFWDDPSTASTGSTGQSQWPNALLGPSKLLQTPNNLTSSQMASNHMAPNQMTSNQMASNQMASNQMASNQMASNQMANQSNLALEQTNHPNTNNISLSDMDSMFDVAGQYLTTEYRPEPSPAIKIEPTSRIPLQRQYSPKSYADNQGPRQTPPKSYAYQEPISASPIVSLHSRSRSDMTGSLQSSLGSLGSYGPLAPADSQSLPACITSPLYNQQQDENINPVPRYAQHYQDTATTRSTPSPLQPTFIPSTRSSPRDTRDGPIRKVRPSNSRTRLCGSNISPSSLLDLREPDQQGFVNFDPMDAVLLMSAVAPSGSCRRKRAGSKRRSS